MVGAAARLLGAARSSEGTTVAGARALVTSAPVAAACCASSCNQTCSSRPCARHGSTVPCNTIPTQDRIACAGVNRCSARSCVLRHVLAALRAYCSESLNQPDRL
jgi:hypothetical protein